jgi:hypothetical protein
MPLGNQLPFCSSFHISSLEDKAIFKGENKRKRKRNKKNIAVIMTSQKMMKKWPISLKD